MSIESINGKWVSRRGLGWLLGWVFLTCVLLPATVWGQWIKLSNSPFSDVREFEISPDGKRVVYTQDTLSPGVFQLWSVPLSGGPPVRLSDSSQPSVSGARISPNGLHVVYVSRDGGGVFQIYRVPTAGGENPLQLSVTRHTGTFLFSPDSERVVFAERVGVVDELYSVPITAGVAPVKLNGALVSGGDVERNDSLISPDGSRVVYLADQQTDEVFELYSAPITGGGAIKLNDALVTGGDVLFDFKVSPDGSRVVYLADQDTDDVFELYSVPIIGGGATKLNGSVVAGGGVGFGFLISPDGSRVVYSASQDTTGVAELYSVPIDGGGPVKLSGMLVADADVSDFSITPDGSRVLYAAGVFPFADLYSVPTAGGAAPVKLSRTGIPAPRMFGFSISPDGNWVVYEQDIDLNRRRGFHASPFGPAESGELLWGTELNQAGYAIDPTSQYVVVRADRVGEADPVLRLWRAPLTGVLPNFTVRELIPKADFVAGGNVFGFEIGPKGSVIYIADQETDEALELYAIPGVIFSNGFE